MLWGSNARETHPIFFHHVAEGRAQRGAKLYVVDPRRTSSARWAECVAGPRRGFGHCACQCHGPRNHRRRAWRTNSFIEHATSGFDAYKARSRITRSSAPNERPAFPPQASANWPMRMRVPPRASSAGLWELPSITTRVDNVLALINLALLTGHVGRYGSGLNPLRGQNNVQGGGDMGAIPDRLTGFQHVENDELRAKFERAWGVKIPPKRGMALEPYV